MNSRALTQQASARTGQKAPSLSRAGELDWSPTAGPWDITPVVPPTLGRDDPHHRQLACTATLVASDIAAFAAATAAIASLATGRLAPAGLANPGPITLALLAAVLLSFYLQAHYTARVPVLRQGAQVVSTVAIALAAACLYGIAVDATPPASALLLRWLAFAPLILAFRGVSAWLLGNQDRWRLRTVVIGDPETGDHVGRALESDRRLGYHVIDTVAASAFADRAAGQGAAAALRASGAGFAVVVLGGNNPDAEQSLLKALDHDQVRYAVVPSTQAMPVSNLTPQSFFGHDVLMLQPGGHIARPAGILCKTLFDLIVAAAMIVVLAPLLALVAIAVRRDGGPALFSHRRIGANGAPFGCLKFRTMVLDADQRLADLLASDPDAAAEWSATRKLRNDPRITPIGRFLRSTSIDELPQLFNVLRGEMSLVGPRPIVEPELVRYDADIAYYTKARPGLTGLWQVSGRSDTSYDRRVRLDVWYVRNWSFWHDIAILLKTVPAVLLRQGSV